MANVFDQFDEQPQGSGNPFDQFDQPQQQQPAQAGPVSAQPVQAEPQGASAMDQARVAQDLYGAARTGLLETAGQFVTGALAEPISGLAGLVGLGREGAEGGTRAVEATQEAFTYQPRTQAGQAVSRAVGEKLEPIAQGAQAVSEAAGEVGFQLGGPEVGAVAYAAPTAIAEVLGMRGTRAAKRAELNAIIEEEGAASLTPETREQLINQGLYTERELSEIAGGDAERLERLARFQRLGIQPTRGDITQQLEAQKPEAQLAQSAQDEAGAAIRTLRQQQSSKLAQSIEQMIDETGVPTDIGNSIKDALKSRKTFVKQRAREAYDALAQQQATTDMPILMDDFRAVPDLPDSGEFRDIAAEMPNQVRSLENLMAEFGLSNDARALSRLEAEGVTPQTLSVANFERLRKRLNRMDRADNTGNMGRIVGPIKRELDKQVDAATDAMIQSGNPNIAGLAKEARQSWIALKEEFDPKSLTEQMIADKPRSTIPQIEDSQVYQKIAAPSTSVEQADRLIQSLRREGAKGNKAIANLQASIGLDLLDSAFRGTTNKMDGQAMLSGPALANRFRKIEDKAKVIFQDSPRALRRLQDVIETAKDVTPQNTAVPKGSAGFIMDTLETLKVTPFLQAFPGGSFVVEGLRTLGARSMNQRALKRALDADKALKRSATIMATDYPSLAAALGIGFLADQESEQDDTTRNQ